ncbi:MAG: hypothetical protein JOZ87_04340 [Chloroflexi bacterium]|nr:hypothetical protein [Chloroflexota bacterium]
MARASAARAAARRLWSATANPDGRGWLERGREYTPTRVDEFDPVVLEAIGRLARLADSVSETLREHPEVEVRRSAAILAARAHPIVAVLDAG